MKSRYVIFLTFILISSIFVFNLPEDEMVQINGEDQLISHENEKLVAYSKDGSLVYILSIQTSSTYKLSVVNMQTGVSNNGVLPERFSNMDVSLKLIGGKLFVFAFDTGEYHLSILEFDNELVFQSLTEFNYTDFIVNDQNGTLLNYYPSSCASNWCFYLNVYSNSGNYIVLRQDSDNQEIISSNFLISSHLETFPTFNILVSFQPSELSIIRDDFHYNISYIIQHRDLGELMNSYYSIDMGYSHILEAATLSLYNQSHTSSFQLEISPTFIDLVPLYSGVSKVWELSDLYYINRLSKFSELEVQIIANDELFYGNTSSGLTFEIPQDFRRIKASFIDMENPSLDTINIYYISYNGDLSLNKIRYTLQYQASTIYPTPGMFILQKLTPGMSILGSLLIVLTIIVFLIFLLILNSVPIQMLIFIREFGRELLLPIMQRGPVSIKIIGKQFLRLRYISYSLYIFQMLEVDNSE